MQIIKIGRSSENDYVTPPSDNSVSRFHAILTIHSSGTATIRDLNSTSGTYVDDKRISDETPLNSSSVIRLGGCTLTLNQIRANSRKSIPRKPVEEIVPDLLNKKTIGRGQENDIRLNSPEVSGKHAVIGLDNNHNVVIIDRNSGNGTYVNGVRINAPAILKKGDKVRLASSATLEWENLFRRESPVSALWIKITVVALFAVALGLGVWKYTNHPWGAQKIYSHYKQSVVMIYNESTYKVKLNGRAPSEYAEALAVLDNVVVDADGDVTPGISGGFGSGFFIDEHGKIMTNKHVLFPMDEAEKNVEKIKEAVAGFLMQMAMQTGIREFAVLANDIDVEYTNLWTGVAYNDTHVQNKNDFAAASPLKKSSDNEIDVAILQLNSKKTPEVVNIVDIQNISAPKDREIGDEVFTIGFPQSLTLGSTPQGLEANNQSGKITQERGENVYGHNITIHQGASGSPVFDEYGKFAGIIVSGFLGLSQGYNQAVMPEKARQFANQ